MIINKADIHKELVEYCRFMIPYTAPNNVTINLCRKSVPLERLDAYELMAGCKLEKCPFIGLLLERRKKK